MGKTERILDNLPGVFRPLPRPTVLYFLADAFGRPLQEAENLLVEVMKSHWVDHADRGRRFIRDLELLAALYSLAPRPDESVEEFREHLKRYVRTYLQGTATVRGILRIAADTLNLTIDDEFLEKPATRSIPSPGDAALALFGVPWAQSIGASAQPAQARGREDVSEGVDLRAAPTLQVRIDGVLKTVDLAAAAADPESASPAEIATALNDAFADEVARHDGVHAILSSGDSGAGATVEFLVPDNRDAADAVFGIAPRVYVGSAARPAQVAGTQDLSGGVELAGDRYLRLALDDVHLAEVDLEGAATLDQVRDRINNALAGLDPGLAGVAGHDGNRLKLTSPTVGFSGNIEVQKAAAQDAAQRLLGPEAHQFQRGTDDSPARLRGRRELNRKVDLTEERNLLLKVDDGEPIEIDCAGELPAETEIQEITAAINDRLGQEVAGHDGVTITLTSPTVGVAGRLEIGAASQGDAADRILGLAPLLYKGSDAASARAEGRIDLRPHVDLRWRRMLRLSVDGAAPKTIDAAGPDPRNSTPEQIAAAINNQLGQAVATVKEGRLVLVSMIAGDASRIDLLSLDRVVASPYRTQVRILDEAATPLFGFVEKHVKATPATGAEVVGEPDLSRGVDLRQRYFLSLGVDDSAPIDVDCRGNRPRVTRLQEIVDQVNAAAGAAVAGSLEGRLSLNSPQTGRESRIAVEPSAAGDAAETLLGFQTRVVQGRAADQVVFTGLADLSLGVDVADRYLVNIRVDGHAPVEIDLRGGLAASPEMPEILLDLFDVEDRINEALMPSTSQKVASHDGRAVILSSPSTGSASRIGLEPPSDPARDATENIFGLAASRVYQGLDATKAEILGERNLSGTLDLTVRRYLRASLDGEAALDIDCAGASPEATTPSEAVQAINRILGPDIARLEGNRLALTSPTLGQDSRLEIAPSTAADASSLLLGSQAGAHHGEPSQPAVLAGTVALSAPLDLSRRDILRIALDGQAPEDLNVAGSLPEETFAEEVVEVINAAFPRGEEPAAAVLTPDGRLQLTAPRSVDLLPLRHIALIEFPPRPPASETIKLTHGVQWKIHNRSVGAEWLSLKLTTVRGVEVPSFVNRSTGGRLWLAGAVGAGQTLRIAVDDTGQPFAEIDGAPAPLEIEPGRDALLLQRGQSLWQYTECHASRFDQDFFDAAYFSGGQCRAIGVFDQSRFASGPDAPQAAVFANGIPDNGTELEMSWGVHEAGRFAVELPVDLPRKYGARFDQGRFAGEEEAAGSGLILEPESEPGSLIAWINGNSALIEARMIELSDVSPVTAPFSQPRSLSGGTEESPARLLVTEPGLEGLVELRARFPGSDGNRIQVTLSEGEGPGTYDLTVGYDGVDVFENARRKVFEQILPARAAGVESTVVR